MYTRLIAVPIFVFLAVGTAVANDQFTASDIWADPERQTVQSLRNQGYSVVVWEPDLLYGLPANDFSVLLENAGWEFINLYAPDWPPITTPIGEQPPGGEIPEEPPLIEATLTLTNGNQMLCLFAGEVAITPDMVIIEGCPLGEEIVCKEFVFADMNTYAPFIEARQCMVQ